jgi:DNA-binding PadR family transcriptional regulator
MNISALVSPPMTAQEFHVLLALYLEGSHIYSLKGAVFNQSRGSIVLEDGTLYPLVKRMEKQALIDNLGKRPSGKSGKRRNYYGISEDGYRHSVDAA